MSKATKTTKARAKKLGIRLTVKSTGKAKSEAVLKSAIKRKGGSTATTKPKKKAIKKLSNAEAKSVARSLGQRGGKKTARLKKAGRKAKKSKSTKRTKQMFF